MVSYAKTAPILRSRFPSPPRSWFPLLGHALWVNKKMKVTGATTRFEIVPQLFDEFGDTFLLEMGPLPILFTRDLDFFKLIANQDLIQLQKLQFDLVSQNITNQGIVFTEGKEWHKKRINMRNAFKKKALESYIPKIHGSSVEMGEVLLLKYNETKGINTDILDYWNRFLTDTIGQVGFSYQFNAIKNPGNSIAQKNWNLILEIVQQQFSNPFYQLLGTQKFLKYTSLGRTYTKAENSLREEFLKFIAPRVEEFRKNPSLKKSGSDILHYLLEASYNKERQSEMEHEEDVSNHQLQKNLQFTTDAKTTGKTYTNEELIHEVTGFFGGGSDTSAAVLAWTIYYIGKYPHIKHKILEELKEAGFYDLKDSEPPTFGMVNKLPYLSQVIKETMRINPPGPALLRQLKEDIEFKNSIIPKGSLVAPHLYSIMRDPRHWKTPTNEFDPDRFNTENSSKRDPMTWAPFGAGARNCIAMQFALLQSRIVLGYLLPRFEFIPTSDPIPYEKVTSSVKNLKLTVQPVQK